MASESRFGPGWRDLNLAGKTILGLVLAYALFGLPGMILDRSPLRYFFRPDPSTFLAGVFLTAAAMCLPLAISAWMRCRQEPAGIRGVMRILIAAMLLNALFCGIEGWHALPWVENWRPQPLVLIGSLGFLAAYSIGKQDGVIRS